MVGEALEAAEQLAAEGIDAEVINMHTIKPIDADLIVKSATKTGHVVTVEEHSVIGGWAAPLPMSCASSARRRSRRSASTTRSASPARVPSSCTSTAWTPPTSWRPPRSSWHKARRISRTASPVLWKPGRGALLEGAPVSVAVK